MQDGSVGTLPSGSHMLVDDVKTTEDAKWPWQAFAKHATQAGLRSLATISVARTWRISSAAEPSAGSEGTIMLHCGQPVSSKTPLLISVMPLRRRPGSEQSPDERLEHSLALPRDPLPKGATRTVKYGPVCRAGAHVVWVTLNGAHVIGSPLQVVVSPGSAEASACELRVLGSNGVPRLPGAGGVSTTIADATKELSIVLQLRDRYGNRCTPSQAREIAEMSEDPAAIAILVVRRAASSASLPHLTTSSRLLNAASPPLSSSHLISSHLAASPPLRSASS